LHTNNYTNNLIHYPTVDEDNVGSRLVTADLQRLWTILSTSMVIVPVHRII